MTAILSEDEVQGLIRENSMVQDGIKNKLGLEGDVKFIPEDKYINGITADFTVIKNDTIEAIIECKSGNINVTDYVRGIGQLLQYEYFAEEGIPHKSFKYSDIRSNKFKTIYFFPSSVIKNNVFNVSKFKYPKSTIILELNEFNYAVRQIDNKEFKKLKEKDDDNLVSISQYYFRDNRIFEYFILLKYLFYQEEKGIDNVDRRNSEYDLKKIDTINNGNWRNAFITLSNLGFINRKNLLTELGKQAAIDNYEMFAVKMYHAYLEPYFSEIQKCFEKYEKIELTNAEIANKIRSRYDGRDVLFLTQSDNRYVSSWLNIMRDDYGILNFESRKKMRVINYNPKELNDNHIFKKIKEYSIAESYIKKYQKLVREGEI